MAANQLPGPVSMPRHDVDAQTELLNLRKQNNALQSRLDDLELDHQKAKNELRRAHGALEALQHVLRPLHQSLRAVFGEIEVVVPDVAPAPSTPNAAPTSVHGPQDVKWIPWIKKFEGSKKSNVLQALLDHGPMTGEQLQVATKSGYTSIFEATKALGNLSLIEKNGSKWQLKP